MNAPLSSPPLALSDHEDDSPFVSIADFFSLISLTLIYSMLVLSPQASEPTDAIQVMSGRFSARDQEQAVDPRYVFVGVRAHGQSHELQIRWAAQQVFEDLVVLNSPNDIQTAAGNIEMALLAKPTPERVILLMQIDPPLDEDHAFFNRLVKAVARRYAVSIVLTQGQDDP